MDPIYVINATYQAEHILPLWELLKAPVILPDKQFHGRGQSPLLEHTFIYNDFRPEIVSYPGKFVELTKDKFLISTGLFRRVPSVSYPNSLFVCHGISDKTTYHRCAARAGFKYYASSGPVFTKMYMANGVKEENIIKCGYIRSCTEVPNYPDFDVLFAPTHNAGTIEPYIDTIIDFCLRKKLKLRIRLHPLTDELVYQRVADKCRPFMPENSVSTWSLLKACKFVITDKSSISYEALLFDKEILMLEGSGSWTHLKGLTSSNFGDVVSFTDKKYLPTYLNRLINYESEKRMSKSTVFYLEDNPAKKCIDFITSVLG